MILLASIPTSLPFEDPILIFGLAMLLVLIAPLLIRLLKLPSIVGLIAAGMVVGPNAAGLLERDATIVLLGTVGLLYLMFMAGLEIDLNEFARSRVKSIVFGFTSFLLPQALGTLLGMQLGLAFWPAVLLGSLLASHTLLAFPIASRLRIGKIESTTMAVGGTILTDVAALFVLAVVVGSRKGELNAEFWITLLGSMVLYTLAVFLIVPRLGRWFFRRVEGDAGADYIFVLAVLFACSFLAEVAGIEAIVGAFFAGLALNRLIPESSTLMNRINFVGNTLFVPFFLLSVGMLVDVRVFFQGIDAIVVAVGMSATVLFAKFAAAKLSQRLFGFTSDQGWVIFGLSVPQAAATLAATLIGFDIGLFDQSIVNGVIVMILVTCVTGPAVVERFGRRVAEAEAAKAPSGSKIAVQRVMVPLLHGADVAPTMDFAMALRDPHSEESLYPVRVVLDDSGPAEVAAAERLLEEAEHVAAGASVPVAPLTRGAPDIPTGLARAIVDQRISAAVLGWDGKAREAHVFGSVIDGLITASACELFVVHLQGPIQVAPRVVVAALPGTAECDGFTASVLAVKKLAHQLGALLTVLCQESERGVVEAGFAGTGPGVATSIVEVAGLDAMVQSLGANLDPADLAVVLTSREVLATEPARRLPGRLRDLLPGSFAVQITSLGRAQEDALDADALEELLGRTRFEVQPGGDALERITALLEMEFHLDDALPERLAAEVRARGDRLDGPGTRVYHLQSDAVPYAVDVVALGDATFEEGTSRTRAIGLVLTPADMSKRAAERRASECDHLLRALVPHLPRSGPVDVGRVLEGVRRSLSQHAA